MISVSQLPVGDEKAKNTWITIHHETEKDYWWFTSKRNLIIQLIQFYASTSSTLLEIGCGGGKLSSELQKLGYQVFSTDYEPTAVEYTKGLGIENAFVCDSGVGLPLKDNCMDLIVMTDVLEHIQDHELAINECKRVLKSGGHIILTVPACPCLFSSWDRWNKHFRRYTRKQLKILAKETNMRIEKLTFWNIPGLPFAVFRKITDIFHHNKTYQGFPPVPRIVEIPLKGFISLENKLIKKISLPVGLSLICILKKTE